MLSRTLQGPGSATYAPLVSPYTPEFYGAGYQGAQSDDWGPAITAAIAAANTAGVNAVLKKGTYGIRTTVVWPSGANDTWLVGPGRDCVLQKLADVTLLDVSGTSGTRRYGCQTMGMKLDGGNNTGWTAPLQKLNYTSRCHTDNMWWTNNYGSAIVGQQAWDNTHTRSDVFNCGGTDGNTPAVSFTAVDADGGNASNNQWFDEFCIETWRSGALWCVGTAAAPVGLFKLGRMKIERVTASTGQGPALRFGYFQDVDLGQVQISAGGSIASGVSQGYVAWMHVYGANGFRIQNLGGYIGAVAAGDVESLIYFDGTTAANKDIRLGTITLHSGSGSGTAKPACVFHWSGTNNYVDRGVVTWDSNYWTVPTDSGSPTTLIGRTGIPVLTAATDTAFNTAVDRTAVDGDEAWFSSSEWRRQGGVWLPKHRSNAYVRNGTNAATLRMSFDDPLAAPDAIVPTVTGIYFVWIPAVTGDVFTKLELPINAGYTLGTTAGTYGYWMALYGANGTGPTSMTLLAWTGELSSSGLVVSGGPESKSIVQDAANGAITSYTVPSNYDGLIYAAFYLNPGSGGSPVAGSLNGVTGKFNIASAAFTGMHKRCQTVTPGSVGPPPTTQAVSGAYANVPLIAAR